MDISLIQGAITSLNTAGQIAKSILGLKADVEIQGKVIDLQSAILSAQQSALAAQADQMAMFQTMQELKKDLDKAKAWDEVKKDYSLIQPSPGSFVFELNDSADSPEPKHWICVTCYEDSKRSILQNKTKGVSTDLYECPSCKSQVKVRGTQDLSASMPRVVRRDPGGF